MDNDNNDRDGLIVEQRIAGRSVPAIAKQCGCSSREVEEAVDRRLDYQLDNAMRMRAVKLDVARLDALFVPFYVRAMKDKDVAAGTLCVKILERRALLLGLDHPTQSRVDVYTVQAQEGPRSYERIRAAIYSVARGPDWRKGNGQLGPPADGDGQAEPLADDDNGRAEPDGS